MYIITKENGALVATDQNGVIRKQMHEIADIYTYEANATLNTPENLKIVERYGDSLELDALNTSEVNGTPINDFATLLTEINALIESLNSISVTTVLDPNAATLSEQEKQTLSLNEISTKESEQIVFLDDINSQLKQREDLDYLDLTLSASTPWAGFPVTINEFQWNDGTFFPANTYPITPTVVNNSAELATLWNANVPDNKLESRDATTLYIKEGSAPVPTDNNGLVQFSTTVPAFGVFPYIRVAAWSQEPDAAESSINVIENKITQLADGGPTSLVVEEFGISTYTAANIAVTLAIANPKRENVIVQVHSSTLWIRLKPAATSPSNREGRLIKIDKDFDLKTYANGLKYTGEISMINAVDAEQPTYSLINISRP